MSEEYEIPVTEQQIHDHLRCLFSLVYLFSQFVRFLEYCTLLLASQEQEFLATVIQRQKEFDQHLRVLELHGLGSFKWNSFCCQKKF